MSSPTDSAKNLINQYIQHEVQFKLDKIIVALSKELNMSKESISKVIEQFDKELKTNNGNADPPSLELDKCMGRTRDNKQCSRSKKSTACDYCGSHASNLRYGRIDDENNGKTNNKGRGRPPKGAKSDLSCPIENS